MINKSSMRAIALALSLVGAPTWAQSQTPSDAPAPAPTGTRPAGTAPLEISRDAPDKHVVVKGDTLWGIAGKFLEKPWRWPEIWQLNREQIRNPHLIYPGDIVYLDNSGPTPRLRLAKSVDGAPAPASTPAIEPAANDRVERSQPRVRSQTIEAAAIPMVRAADIEPFLNRPLIVDEKGLDDHPRIVGAQEGRVYLGRGDIAYVRGLKDKQVDTDWYVYRSAKPLLDPDTRKPIAYEAIFLGAAKLERRGDPATFRIVGANEEIGEGDRLVPAERARALNYAPRPPDGKLTGRIVSVYRGVAQAGRNSVVAMNLGTQQGVAVGHVLAIKERAREIKDRETKEGINLPGEPIGHLLVFRVFDKIAYGLIMDAYKAVTVGDDIVNP
ncbi:MAG: LysM peptidoglycan-binding domain-containing protein [Burkholderiaceae bacterium]|nr:LysM peptidoglycan-binding domain-containing protein [Burkholderiaceae bacterium]